jgi:hypothetical protein
MTTRKNVRVIAGTGTAGIEQVRIYASPTGPTGTIPQWVQQAGFTGPTGTFKVVQQANTDGPTGVLKRVIIDGFTATS